MRYVDVCQVNHIFPRVANKLINPWNFLDFHVLNFDYGVVEHITMDVFDKFNVLLLLLLLLLGAGTCWLAGTGWLAC